MNLYKDEIVLHIATEPTRKKILFSLPTYSSEIARKLQINPKNAEFHLHKLEEYGLAESEFELANGHGPKPVAIRRFILTAKGRMMKETLLNWEKDK